MARAQDIALTTLAPAIWGSTYIVTTELLPAGYPLTTAMLRALPAGLLLLAWTRRLPAREWLGRIALLGALNFTIFWSLLFVSAYRLPGGVAATVGAVQALIVVFLARLLLGTPIRGTAIIAALIGTGGVAALVLTPQAALDPIGVLAGLGAAASMAAGTVLSRKWRPEAPPLAFTAWQLTAGGLLLLPLSFAFEPALPPLAAPNIAGLAFLGLIGAAATYALWFRGVERIEPAAIATLAFFSPLSAVLLGWTMLGQSLTSGQLLGGFAILCSVWLGQASAEPQPSSASRTAAASSALR